MATTDAQLEIFYRDIVAERPLRKFEETTTSFDRRIFWYDRDELSRQADDVAATPQDRITYEDHRRAIESAMVAVKNPTQHELAMTILSSRFFRDYRAKAFAGEGSFLLDYSFLIKKIAMVFNHEVGAVKYINVVQKLSNYTTPTLVQINHITGDVTEVNVPSNNFTLNEWATKYNTGAPESTSYRLVGVSI